MLWTTERMQKRDLLVHHPTTKSALASSARSAQLRLPCLSAFREGLGYDYEVSCSAIASRRLLWPPPPPRHPQRRRRHRQSQLPFLRWRSGSQMTPPSSSAPQGTRRPRRTQAIHSSQARPPQTAGRGRALEGGWPCSGSDSPGRACRRGAYPRLTLRVARRTGL